MSRRLVSFAQAAQIRWEAWKTSAGRSHFPDLSAVEAIL